MQQIQAAGQASIMAARSLAPAAKLASVRYPPEHQLSGLSVKQL